MAEDLVNILADLKEKEALEIVEKRLSAGEDPLGILNDARKALERVTKEEREALPVEELIKRALKYAR